MQLQPREATPVEEATTGAAEQPVVLGDTVSKHMQDAPPSVGASPVTESSSTVSPHKLIPIPEEDMREEADQPDDPGDVVSKHLQDAPPSVGASHGTQSSTTDSHHEIIKLPEVELRQKEALPAEVDSERVADQQVESMQKETSTTEKATPEPSSREDLDHSSKEDQTEIIGQLEGLGAVGCRDLDQESEEEGPEQESTILEGGEKPTTEGVPKHRRTFCRKASCVSCKEQCGSCKDCATNNSKTVCRERQQCPDKKRREIRPGKVKETVKTLTPGGGTSHSGEAKSRSRSMLRRSQSLSEGTPVKIPDVFQTQEAPDDNLTSKKQKQGGMNEEDNKRRNTSCEDEAEARSERRNSISGQSTSTMRRPSGLPVFSAVCKAGESTPHEVVAGHNP